MPPKRVFSVLYCVIVSALFSELLAADDPPVVARRDGWLQHDLRRPKAPVVEPVPGSGSVPAPRDAIVLFDGRNLDAWRADRRGTARWKVADGYFEVAPGTGAIETKAKFGDVQLHVEWASPDPPDGKGQDRGNSGIFLMGVYELQVLDSYHADTYADGQAGAIYGQYPPLANASRPPGQWQTYDIAFRRPRFDSGGKLLEPARITLIHNGILVQNNEEPWGQTSWLESLPEDPALKKGPIQLQDHGHKVRFRNIWLRELPERAEPSPRERERPPTITLAAEVLDEYVGRYEMSSRRSDAPASITREGSHLIIKLPWRQLALVMEPISPTEFVLPRTDARFTFQKDASGRVTGVVFKISDGERVMKRLPNP
jgi:hypothetical protein